MPQRRMEIWEATFQNWHTHPQWTVPDHVNYLTNEAHMDLSVLLCGTPAVVIARWLYEFEHHSDHTTKS